MKPYLLAIPAILALSVCIFLMPREEESSAVLTAPAQLYIEQTEPPQTEIIPPPTSPAPETTLPVTTVTETREVQTISLAETQHQISLSDAVLEQRTETQPDSSTAALPVMIYCQYPDYPTGCECAALYMLLDFYGTEVTMEQLADVIPKGAAPSETEEGTLYGANPEKCFVGDPRNTWSYGVFNAPVAQTANQFREGALSRTGATLEEALAIVDGGNPVIAWYTTDPVNGIVYRRSWYDSQTGEKIIWPGNEHAVVITWHDDTHLSYNDSNTGKSVTVETEFFRKIFDELGGRIVYYEE